MEALKFYRYDIQYSNSEQSTRLYLQKFPVISETKKGYWIWNANWNFKKWIPKEQNAHKQYAWATKERAMIHLINRNIDRVKWYKYWIKESEKAIKIWKQARAKGITDEVYIDFDEDYPPENEIPIT